MSNWTIYTQNSGLVWVEDVSGIPRPQQSMPVELISTEVENSLADGSRAFIVPETKIVKSDLVFTWYEQSQTFKEQLEDYITNYDYIKIVTHISGLEFIGRFKSVRPIWLVGIEDKWDIEATFSVQE